MLITHLVEDLNRGGLERVVIDLIRKQIDLGHSCQVVCLLRIGIMAEQLLSLGVEVRSCDKKDGFDFMAMLKARKYIKDFRTEVLHTHNIMPHYYGVISSISLNIKKRLNTSHNMGDYRYSRKQEYLFRVAMLFSDAWVLVCEAARERHIKNSNINKSKTKVISNGIMFDLVKQRNKQSKDKFLKDIAIDKDVMVIGTVGRLSKVKDHVTLIQAFYEVLKRKNNALLVIVGGGELENEIKTNIKNKGIDEKVIMLGDRSDVYELLAAFDIYAVSSVSEGHSIALLEACAAALPIVATDVGGNNEIVKPDVNGYLVPPKNPVALADGIFSLCDDSRKREALGLSGRRWVEKNASVDVMAERYSDIYQFE